MKDFSKRGVLLAIESGGYGAGGGLNNATDGFLAADEFDIEDAFQDTGAREGRSAGGFAELQRGGASGYSVRTDIPHFFRGPAPTAYSASVFSTVHNFLRMLLGQAAFSATPTPRWTYTPLSTGYATAHGELYTMGERTPVRGIVGQRLEIAAAGKVTPRWMCGIQGIGTLPADAAVPSITYPNKDIASPKAINIALILDATFSGRVVEHTVTIERVIEELENQNDVNGDHMGFALGALTARIQCVIEATNLTGSPFRTATLIDPYRLYSTGAKMSVALQHGTVQYNRWKLNSASAQFNERPIRSRGPQGVKARWELDIGIKPTDDATELDLSIITD